MATAAPEASPRATVPGWLLAVLVAGWAGATGYAFWALGLRDRRPLGPDEVAAYFDAVRVAPAAEAWWRSHAPPGAPVATVVHVTPSACPCTKAANRHVERIEAAYGRRPVAFLRAQPPWVAAAPAALVFDAGGRLVYFGPYSDDADCGAGGGFVERVLGALLGDARAAPPRPLGIGCYCVTPTRA